MVTTDTELNLPTITESGTMPKRRLEDAADARQIVTNLLHANQDRSRFNAKLRGLVDGNPPYDAAKLRAHGQAHRTNLNFMETKASISAAAIPYYDLFSGAHLYARIETDAGTSGERSKYSDIISEEFSRMLRDWMEFDYHMQSMIFDMVGWGKGFFLFPHDRDWRYEHVEHMRVYVPDGTKCNVPCLDLLVVRQRMPVHQLWAKIKDKDIATKAGWNPEAVAEAIERARPEDSNASDHAVSYEYVQNRIKDRDLYEGTRSKTVPVAHVFIREFGSGKVTHGIVEEDSAVSRAGMAEEDIEWMFYKPERFGAFSQVISAFFLETMDGSWNGASGLLKEIYGTMELKNRLKCSALDNSFLRAGVILKAMSAASLQKTAVVQMGTHTIFPPDFEVMQNNVLGDVEGLFSTDRQLENMLSSNTGVYRQRMDQPKGNPRTAEEVRLQFMNSAVLGNSAVNRFYLNLDRHYREVWRRASDASQGDSESGKAAREMIKRCRERDVPMEAIRKTRSINAERVIGNGSQFMRQQNILQLGQWYPMLPSSGQKRFIQQVVSVTAGQSMVQLFAPDSDEMDSDKMNQQGWALMENDSMVNGSPVQWSPTQDDVVHAEIHLSAAAQSAKSLANGAEPAKVLGFLELVGPHTAQHLQSMATDPGKKQVTAVLTQQFQKIAKFTDQLKQQIDAQQQAHQENAQKLAQAQAIAAGTDGDTAIKAAKTADDMKWKGAKAAQQMKSKQEAHDQDMMIKGQNMIMDVAQRSAEMSNARPEE